MKEYVAGFLFRNAGLEVALVEKLNPEWQRGKLNGIGGKIEGDETPEQAMVREFKEETSLDIQGWRKFCELDGPATGGGWKVHFFVAHAEAPYALQAKNDVGEQLLWAPVLHLRMLPVIPNLHWLVPLALDKDKVVATVSDPTTPPAPKAEVETPVPLPIALTTGYSLMDFDTVYQAVYTRHGPAVRIDRDRFDYFRGRGVPVRSV